MWNLIKFATLSTCLRGVIEYTTCLASAQDKGGRKKEDWGLGPPPHSHSSVFLFSHPPPIPHPPSFSLSNSILRLLRRLLNTIVLELFVFPSRIHCGYSAYELPNRLFLCEPSADPSTLLFLIAHIHPIQGRLFFENKISLNV